MIIEISFAYLYNACSVKEKKGFPSIPFLSKFHSTAYKDGAWRNSNSFCRASYADGWLPGPALQNHTLVWEGHLEVIQSNFPPRADCSGPCPVEFSIISERLQNLSHYLQVTLMMKKNFFTSNYNFFYVLTCVAVLHPIAYSPLG